MHAYSSLLLRIRLHICVQAACHAGDAPADPSSPPATMASLLASHAVPEALHYHFAEFTPEVFANVAADATSLDRFLASLVENFGPDQFVVEARVRMLWKECASLQCSTAKKSSSEEGGSSNAAKPDSWADPYPAKLSPTVWKGLRDEFLAAYPSELLSPEETAGGQAHGIDLSGCG